MRPPGTTNVRVLASVLPSLEKRSGASRDYWNFQKRAP